MNSDPGSDPTSSPSSERPLDNFDRPNTEELRRVITLPWLILYGIGATVGAGIYALTGAIAGRAGMLAPASFGIAALLAIFTALSFAELSARFPQAGGALIYVKEGFRSTALSLVVGLFAATAGIVSAATVSVGFVGYLAELVSLPSALPLVVVVLAIGAVASWGVKESIVLAGILTIVEVLGLLLVLGFGTVELLESPPSLGMHWPTGLTISDGSAVLGGSLLAFYAFLGFEDIVNVAEEVKDVRRVMPRAILYTLGISTLLYVSVTLVAVLVVTPTELASSNAPLALVFETAGGSPELLASIALAAMLNGALVQVLMASRVLFSLARQGLLPKWLSHVHPERRTPIAATLFVTAVVAVCALSQTLESLAAATALIALMLFTLVNASLVALRLRETSSASSTSPQSPVIPIWVPIVGAISSALFLALECLRPG